MPEGDLTSASSSRYIPDKTAGRNSLNEQESNAILDNSGLDLDEPVPGGTILSILNEFEYVWTGDFDLNTLLSHNVWTRIFLYPERKSCGLKNIWIRVDRSLFFNHTERACLVASHNNKLICWLQSFNTNLNCIYFLEFFLLICKLYFYGYLFNLFYLVPSEVVCISTIEMYKFIILY